MKILNRSTKVEKEGIEHATIYIDEYVGAKADKIYHENGEKQDKKI